MTFKPVAGLFLSALAVAPLWSSQPTADEIIANLTQAVGGTDRIKSVYSLKTTSHLLVAGTKGEASVVSTMKTPQMVYTEITRGGTKFVECFDGHIKWAKVDGGPAKKAPDEEAKSYAADTWVMIDGPLVDYKAKGHKVDFLGEEDVNGTPTYKMHVVMKSGNTEDIYLNQKTYLPFKQVTHSSRNGHDTETVGYMLDYKTYDGITMATTLLIKVGNAAPIRLKIDNIEFNFPLTEAFFKMPE
jgi:hypothetical protein